MSLLAITDEKVRKPATEPARANELVPVVLVVSLTRSASTSAMMFYVVMGVHTVVLVTKPSQRLPVLPSAKQPSANASVAKGANSNASTLAVSMDCQLGVWVVLTADQVVIGPPYEMRMIADVFDGSGNCTVNVELDVLSEPKSKTHIVGFVVPLSK